MIVRYLALTVVDGDLNTFRGPAYPSRAECVARLLGILREDSDQQGLNQEWVLADAAATFEKKDHYVFETTEYAVVEVEID